jgi:putative ABC transport system substrate-binding protein
MLLKRLNPGAKLISLPFLILFLSIGNPAGFGKEKPKKIILIETMPVPVVLGHCKWFITHLNKMGYRQGSNVDLVVLKANGDRSRAKNLLKEALSKGSPDLVVTSATMASQAAKEVLEGSNIPIVFMTVSDPVGAGLIDKIGIPTKSNITGKVHMIDRQTRANIVMRTIESAVAKKPVRIGFIHSSYPSAVGDLRELKLVSQEREDIQFLSYQIAYRKVPHGLPQMLKDTIQGVEELKNKVDFWWEPSGPLGEVGEYTKAILDHSNVPIVMGTKLKSVELGAILHLTPCIEASGRETSMLADAIIKGAHPGEIPATPPSAFDMGINLTTALNHNIVIPPDLLQLAGDHIYR